MKTLVIFSCALLITGTVWADVFSEAKQQARHAADPPTSRPAPPPATSAQPPVNPALVATLQNISSLKNDLTALNNFSATQPDSSLKTSLLNDLVKAAQGNKPTSAAVEKLANDLATAVTGKKKMPLERLARDIHALFNSSHLSGLQQKNMMDDVNKILTEIDTSTDDLTSVSDDLKTISAATK